MNVILAGFNLDYETIKELQKVLPDADNLTPETISAAYARISRNPRPVNELRAISRREVDKARKSNQVIVFDMGHNSVAEHAVFNIDIIGTSRLIVEEIEKFRLCSYTEKSQRYIRLADDYVLPEEIMSSGLATPFKEQIEAQNRLYHRLYERLKVYVFDIHDDLAADPKNHSMLDGWAKEDARYVISLATEAQLGMTVNARNLELMIRRCAAHPLSEVRQYGQKLYEATCRVAPSLVRYTDATDYDSCTRGALNDAARALTEKYMAVNTTEAPGRQDHNVTLYHVTPGADDTIIASLLHASARMPMGTCRTIVSRMTQDEKELVFRTAWQHMQSYDPPLREFENVDLHFEIIMSASCFAQFKRHRMATIIAQEYDPSLGVTVPPAVDAVGLRDAFMDIMSTTDKLYYRIKDTSREAAAYILTNAHRKRVLAKVNTRELYHMARLREDRHAQWDIRQTTERMVRLGKHVMPLTLQLACGKDRFKICYNELF